MARPALEVADILRDHGPAWREANRGHVSLEQLKVRNAERPRISENRVASRPPDDAPSPHRALPADSWRARRPRVARRYHAQAAATGAASARMASCSCSVSASTAASLCRIDHAIYLVA